MTTLEKMARAICKAQGDDWYREGPGGLMEAYGPLARAALEAMREPSDADLEAFSDASDQWDHPSNFYLDMKRYGGMIDAILEGK